MQPTKGVQDKMIGSQPIKDFLGAIMFAVLLVMGLQDETLTVSYYHWFLLVLGTAIVVDVSYVCTKDIQSIACVKDMLACIVMTYYWANMLITKHLLGVENIDVVALCTFFAVGMATDVFSLLTTCQSNCVYKLRE